MHIGNSWSHCPDGHYVTGLQFSADKTLAGLKAAKCCRIRPADPQYRVASADCNVRNWENSIAHAGYASASTNYFIRGLYRGGHTLSQLRMAEQCLPHVVRDVAPGQCVSWGDTHITTLSHTYYDLQAAGEFTFFESKRHPIKIHSIQTLNAPPAYNTGAAFKAGDDLFSARYLRPMAADIGLQYRFNSQVVHLKQGKQTFGPFDIFLHVHGQGYHHLTITHRATGLVLVIDHMYRHRGIAYMNMVLVTPYTFAEDTTGLCGNFKAPFRGCTKPDGSSSGCWEAASSFLVKTPAASLFRADNEKIAYDEKISKLTPQMITKDERRIEAVTKICNGKAEKADKHNCVIELLINAGPDAKKVEEEMAELEQREKDLENLAEHEVHWCKDCLQVPVKTKIGWVTCPAGTLLTGVARSDVNNLDGVTYLMCCKACKGKKHNPVGLGNCNVHYIGNTMGGAGNTWSACPTNQYIQGYHRHAQSALTSMTHVMCCGLVDSFDSRRSAIDKVCSQNVKVASALDKPGWTTIGRHTFLRGLFRDKGTTLSNLQSVSQCSTEVQIDKTPGNCHSWGDPHMGTLSGVNYDWYGNGEFVYLKSTSKKPELQTQLNLIQNRRPPVAFNTGFAIRQGADTWSFRYRAFDVSTDNGINLFNGKETSIKVGFSQLGPFDIQKTGNDQHGRLSILVRPNGLRIYVTYYNYGIHFMDVVLSVPYVFAGATEGMCGAFRTPNVRCTDPSGRSLGWCGELPKHWCGADQSLFGSSGTLKCSFDAITVKPEDITKDKALIEAAESLCKKSVSAATVPACVVELLVNPAAKERLINEMQKISEDKKKLVSSVNTPEISWCNCEKVHREFGAAEAGWASCPAGFLLTGMRRGHEDNLKGVTDLQCCKPCRGSQPLALHNCYWDPWWQKIKNYGWTTCANNYFLTGYYKLPCNNLECLQWAQCCQIKDNDARFFIKEDKCAEEKSWENTFQREGWSLVREHMWTRGFFRTTPGGSTQGALSNIQRPYQCEGKSVRNEAPGYCHAVGDPHYATLSGARYDMYRSGEFVLFKSPGHEAQINAVVWPYYAVSLNVGFAMKFRGHVFTMRAVNPLNWRADPEFTYDGKVIPPPTTGNLGPFRLIVSTWSFGATAWRFQIMFGEGAADTEALTMTAMMHGWQGHRYSDFYLRVPFSYAGDTTGMCGPFRVFNGHCQGPDGQIGPCWQKALTWQVPATQSLFNARTALPAQDIKPVTPESLTNDPNMILAAKTLCAQNKRQDVDPCVIEYLVNTDRRNEVLAAMKQVGQISTQAYAHLDFATITTGYRYQTQPYQTLMSWFNQPRFSRRLARFGMISQSATFNGPNHNIGYRFSIELKAAKSVNIAIRAGVDFGLGGVIFYDGQIMVHAHYDMWWAYNWGNTRGVLQTSWFTIAPGQHRIDIIGFENCCDGQATIQFRTQTSDWQDVTDTVLKQVLSQ